MLLFAWWLVLCCCPNGLLISHKSTLLLLLLSVSDLYFVLWLSEGCDSSTTCIEFNSTQQLQLMFMLLLLEGSVPSTSDRVVKAQW